MKLSSKLYLAIYELDTKNKLKSEWIKHVKKTLCETGFSGIWYCQSFSNAKWLTKSTHRKFTDIFIQNWHSEIEQTSNTNLYKYFKTNFQRNVYLENLPIQLSKQIVRFLSRNHRLPVETGRWQNKPYRERKCLVCTDIGDEFHYLLICPLFFNDRLRYINEYYRNRPCMGKLITLINSNDVTLLTNFSIMCGKIMQYFKQGN